MLLSLSAVLGTVNAVSGVVVDAAKEKEALRAPLDLWVLHVG